MELTTMTETKLTTMTRTPFVLSNIKNKGCYLISKGAICFLCDQISNSLWWVHWKPVCFCWCFRQPCQFSSDLKWKPWEKCWTPPFFSFLLARSGLLQFGPAIENPIYLNKHLLYHQILLQYNWTQCMIDINNNDVNTILCIINHIHSSCY